jgi:hypothetical protein
MQNMSIHSAQSVHGGVIAGGERDEVRRRRISAVVTITDAAAAAAVATVAAAVAAVAAVAPAVAAVDTAIISVRSIRSWLRCRCYRCRRRCCDPCGIS